MAYLFILALLIVGFILVQKKHNKNGNNTIVKRENINVSQHNSSPTFSYNTKIPTELKSKGEKLYLETVKMSIDISNIENPDERLALRKQLISHYKQALQLGLSKYDQVGCHTYISDTLLHYVNEANIEAPDELVRRGLEAMPNRSLAIMEFERALEIDSKIENKFFVKEINRASFFPNISSHWDLQGRYLLDNKGFSHAINYLIEKIYKLGYLSGAHMPNVCFSIACYYADSGNETEAIKWFKEALDAEEFDENGPLYKHYKKVKNLASENLNTLLP